MTLKSCDKWDDISSSTEACIADNCIWMKNNILNLNKDKTQLGVISSNQHAKKVEKIRVGSSYRRRHIWKLFHLWLRFITLGGCSDHLAYDVHKCGLETSFIIIIIITNTHKIWALHAEDAIPIIWKKLINSAAHQWQYKMWNAVVFWGHICTHANLNRSRSI